MERSCLVILLVFFTSIFSTLPISYGIKDLCPRIFFKNLDERQIMPYKMIEGVYVKQTARARTDLKYKRENGNLLFYRTYYHRQDLELIFGRDANSLDSDIGLGAKPKVGYVRWLWDRISTLDRNDVFKGLIDSWMYRTKKMINGKYHSYWELVKGSPGIQAMCVDEDFHQCDSSEIYLTKKIFDHNGEILNNPSFHTFKRKLGTFRSLRAVYYQQNNNLILQYQDGYWFISQKFSLHGVKLKDWLARVKDLALRPEFITNTWEIYDGNKWEEIQEIKIKCYHPGFTSLKCSQDVCGKYGDCMRKPNSKYYCKCSQGYSGSKCEIPGCPILAPTAEIDKMEFVSSSIGSLSHVSCTRYSNYRIYVTRYSSGVALCKIDLNTNRASWEILQGRFPCSHQEQNQNQKYVPRFDRNPKIFPAILSTAIILQVLLPWFISCCCCCFHPVSERKRSKSAKGSLDDEIENSKSKKMYKTAGKPEWMKKQKEHDENTGMLSLARLYSLCMYFSFFLWIAFLIGCDKYECLNYGEIFYHLRLMAIVMSVLAPLFVLIETCMSREWSYIAHIMEDESAYQYIQNMIKVAPLITMNVKCYKYEERMVERRDSDGHKKYKKEIEKVLTHQESAWFKYGCWADISSKEMPSTRHSTLTCLKISSWIDFGNEKTAHEFKRQKEAMLERNKTHGTSITFSSEAEIPGIKRRISALGNINQRPWWLSNYCFFLASVFCLSWPYRWYFKAKTTRQHFMLEKTLYKDRNPPPQSVDANYFELKDEGNHIIPVSAADNTLQSEDPASPLLSGPSDEVPHAQASAPPLEEINVPYLPQGSSQTRTSGLPLYPDQLPGYGPAYPSVQVKTSFKDEARPSFPVQLHQDTALALYTPLPSYDEAMGNVEVENTKV